jgi:glucosylceramidase
MRFRVISVPCGSLLAVLVAALGCGGASDLTVSVGFAGDDGPAGVGDPFENATAGCAPAGCAFVPATARIVQTSKAGDRLRDMGGSSFSAAGGSGSAVVVDPAALRQEIVGFGPAFTESAASVLLKVPADLRTEVLESLFGPKGAAFTLTRTHNSSCDFGPVGNYSYSSRADLSDFTVAEDEPDLLPMIIDSAKVSRSGFRIVASPWSAPPFMKDNGKYYDRVAGRGGKLLPEHYATFAKYVSKYLTAYHDHGVDIWAVTPQNEPVGNDGQWEGMEFSPEELTRYVGQNLGPTLAAANPGVKILNFDHNRDAVERYASAAMSDPDASKYVDGTGVHWYASTYRVFGDELDRIHQAYGSDHLLINTEAAVEILSIHSQDYFGRWDYFWDIRGPGPRPWEVPPEAFPPTSLIGHYLVDIVGGLNHWLNGFVEWNMVIDEHGGPRHICEPSIDDCGVAAPIMIDTDGRRLFYTPIYYVLSHFSKFIRPGARVLATSAPAGLIATAAWNPNGTIAVVVVNTFEHPSQYAQVVDRDYCIQIGDRSVQAHIAAHAIQTIVVSP